MFLGYYISMKISLFFTHTHTNTLTHTLKHMYPICFAIIYGFYVYTIKILIGISNFTICYTNVPCFYGKSWVVRK